MEWTKQKCPVHQRTGHSARDTTLHCCDDRSRSADTELRKHPPNKLARGLRPQSRLTPTRRAGFLAERLERSIHWPIMSSMSLLMITGGNRQAPETTPGWWRARSLALTGGFGNISAASSHRSSSLGAFQHFLLACSAFCPI